MRYISFRLCGKPRATRTGPATAAGWQTCLPRRQLEHGDRRPRRL